jgi:hypothetical protein
LYQSSQPGERGGAFAAAGVDGAVGPAVGSREADNAVFGGGSRARVSPSTLLAPPTVTAPSRVRPSTDRLCCFSERESPQAILAAPAGTRTVTPGSVSARRFHQHILSKY